MQCAGFLSGLHVADAFIRSGGARRVLLVGAECHASLFPWTDADWAVLFGESEGPVRPEAHAWGTVHRDRAVIFGDGAGAFVLEAHSGGRRPRLRRLPDAHGRRTLGQAATCRAAARRAFPTSRPEMFADNRTVPVVEGRQVYRLATTAMPEIVREILALHGLAPSDLALLLMHQANLRINEAVQKSLGLSDAPGLPQHPALRQHDRGDPAPRVPRGAAAGRIRPGDLVGFTALGAGLHWGAALMRA